MEYPKINMRAARFRIWLRQIWYRWTGRPALLALLAGIEAERQMHRRQMRRSVG